MRSSTIAVKLEREKLTVDAENMEIYRHIYAGRYSTHMTEGVKVGEWENKMKICCCFPATFAFAPTTHF